MSNLILHVGNGGVPAGSYLARFAGIEQTSSEEYGAGLRWQFEVMSGPQKGAKTSRITSPTPTLKNACGKMLAGIVGKALTPGEDVKLDQFVGTTYLIVVNNTDSGSTRIESVSLPPVG